MDTSLRLILLTLPTLYTLVIIAAFVKSGKNEKPEKLYHVTNSNSANKILKDRKFTTRTEGLAFFSPNPKTKFLGKDFLSFSYVRNYFINLNQKHHNFFTKTLERIFYKKGADNVELKTIVISANAVSLFRPIFQKKIYNIMNVWSAWKMLTGQWVTIKQGDIIFCRFNEKKEVICAHIESKTGGALILAKLQKLGMRILNLIIFLSMTMLALLAFFQIPSIFIYIMGAIFFLTILVILGWFFTNKYIYRCVEKTSL